MNGEEKSALESQVQSEVEPTIATQASKKLSSVEQSETIETAHVSSVPGLVDVAVSKADCKGIIFRKQCNLDEEWRQGHVQN